MGILTAFTSVVEVLPFVQQIITAAESMFGSGNGTSKQEVTVSATVAGLETYAKLKGITLPSTFQSDIAAAINANVLIMNELGLLLPHSKAASNQ